MGMVFFPFFLKFEKNLNSDSNGDASWDAVPGCEKERAGVR